MRYKSKAMSHIRTLAATAAAGALLLAPSFAQAQTCLGDAAMSGQFTVGGFGSFMDGGKAFGVESRSNLPGSMGLGARLGVIDLDDTDERITTSSANLSLELARRGQLSLCPVVGVEYDYWSGTFAGVDFDYSRLAFPLGFAIGSRVGGTTDGSVSLIPSAQAGLIHQRFSGSAGVGSLVFERDGDETDPFLEAGATVHFGSFYARGGIYRIFEDNAESVFRIGAGFVF